ncbi:MULTISPECIES: McrB family protein [unclassified Acinetobacter]|uniref:McrB family protein n=2 Tax=Acinetobacter TaxID=469 RepID=UPI0027D2459C|nr:MULTISPECIES: AAA family ATPase [unclassified Acinetobacter]
MELELLKKRFDTPKLNKYLEQLDETTEGNYWASIAAIQEIFPNADIYHAGSSKFGYLGVGIKPESNVRVKEFTLVCSLNENCDEDGHYYIEYGVIKNLYMFIKKQDTQISQGFEPVKDQIEDFKDWLKQIKKYAIEFKFNLNGQALLPSDYDDDFQFTTEEAHQYLNKRYQVIETEKDNKKVVGFRNAQGRECALNLEVQNPSIFIGINPEDNHQFAFDFLKKKNGEIAKYLEYEGRHSGLENNAPSLYTGHKAFYIGLNTFKDLEKFCDWYEQSDDQSSALEHKVKTFLMSWPAERLAQLSIEDYHQAKNINSFIAQIDSFDPTQGEPTFANYFDMWEPVNLGKDEKYHNEKPYSWHKRLGSNAELAFETLKQEILDIVDASQHRDLNAIDQISFPKGLKWMIAFLYQDFSNPLIIPIVTETNIKRIGYAEYAKKPLPEFLPILLAGQGTQAFFPYVEKLFAMVRKGYLDNKQKKQQTTESVEEVMTQQPLNRILFGAAGTGKTFHSINHALSIIENKPLEVLEQEGRTALKARFDQYKEQGQIKFVTFHQSFSYEDFVEGIRAETNEEGQLSYDVKAGVFKEICDNAFNQNLPHSNVEEVMHDFCKQVAEQPLKLKTKTGLTYEITYEGGKTLKCFLLESVNKGTYSLSLDTIRKLLHGIELGNYGMPSYIKPIVSLLSNKIQFSDDKSQDIGQKPYVLIIDEINRGNISRIFGELITLIEDSKRQGAEEQLSVTLPYSKEEFSVPSNVYIIGTMNSSDRSLTGLDVALRRRFTFIEMPPKPELLNDIVVEGLNIGELLRVINQRIEVLLNRDHCVGHANFMSLKKDRTLKHLAAIFKQKIIPQLQEYFFDDWAKINMVLNANGMFMPKTVVRSELFPDIKTESEDLFEERKTWTILESAFDSIETFTKIIRH